MTFAQMNLAPSIAKAVNVCGYTDPTPVQKQSIPKILNGEDVVACAQTGTGKTAAFVLPALHLLDTPTKVRRPRILILTPTRELASQITKAAAKYGKFIRFYMASLVGGMPYKQQIRDLSRSVDMIIATPGRLMDHMESGRIDLSGIEMLILDEADRMLDMGFIEDVQFIAEATPENRQTLLFSATVDGKLRNVVNSLLKDPAHIDLSQEKISPAQITQELYLADNPQHKERLLQHFLQNTNIFKAIIFSATKIGAEKLAGQLRDQGYAAAALHGDLKQSMRNRTVEQLRSGKVQFVVATDVAARGIDIADMTHVINYDLPRFCEDYVHRIGRTGRAGKSGVAISFALPSDHRHVVRIENYIGQRLMSLTIPGLEPTRKKQKASSDQPNNKRSKKSFGKPSAKFGRKSEGERSEGRFGRKSGGERSEGRFGRGSDDNKSEKRFGRKSGGERSEGRFGRASDDNKSEQRFGRKSGGERSEGRFGRGSDDNKSERKFGRKSGGERSEGRFGRASDDNKSESRFSRKSEGKRFEDGFSRKGNSEKSAKFGRKSEGDRFEGKSKRNSDGGKSEGRFGRKADGDKSAGRFGRKTDGDKPAGRFGRKADSGKPAGKFGSKSANAKAAFPSKDGRKKDSKFKPHKKNKNY